MSNNTNRARQTKAQRRHDTAQAYGVMVGLFACLMVMAVYFMFFHNSDKDSEAAELPKVINYNTQKVDLSDADARPADNSAVTDESSQDEPASSTPDESVSDTSENTADTSAAHESAPDPTGDHKLEVINGITYVDGIMIVNKTYSLPQNYAPGLDPVAEAAFNQMASDSWGDGVSLFICSGYRSYQDQEKVYSGYARERGYAEADKVSSRPGHSEHQSGLAMDINTTDYWFTGTKEAIWLEEHCADYGFIIRFPEGKESVTGYEYEPWHIRYVGVDVAKEITSKGLCLEEYLGVTSDYRYAPEYNG